MKLSFQTKPRKASFHLPIAALGAGVMLFQTPLADAAVITWGSATDVVSTSDVSTNGTPVEAFNLGYTGTLQPTGPATVTVNTVTFTALAGPAPLNFTTAVAYDSLNGGTTGNSDYDQLLNSVAYGGGGSTSMTLGGGNLVSGQQYEIQVWFVEEKPASSSRVMTYGDGNGNTVNVGGTAGLLGQYATGTFTADGANQTLTLVTNGFGNAHLNGYQIRLIPEPSAALLGVGVLAFFLRRRR